ncbi:MAG: CapA family protein [Steroidobacteraceae bacterium]
MRPAHVSRRQLLLGALTLPSLAVPSLGLAANRTRRDPLRVALLGQCLIRHDLREQPWPGFRALQRRLRRHDVVFSDLETVIAGPRAGAPTRALETVHTADAVALDCLRDFGITILATGNNHSFDVGTGGILDTIDALRARGIPFAGSGVNLAAAAAPGYQDTANGRFALVAAAAGMIRPGGAATEDRAGVHELRTAPSGGLDGDDVERMLASIRSAAADADVVLAYLHNHLWETDISRTPDWQREFARRCIDAGASAFCAHGTPLLQGIELYRGAPLFHGLGSFIFQTRKADDAYGDVNWESVIAECRFEGKRVTGVELLPVQLASIGAAGPDDLMTRGRPSPASRSEARATLARLAALSARLDYRLQVNGTRGIIAPS